jgi:hypothetical protein
MAAAHLVAHRRSIWVHVVGGFGVYAFIYAMWPCVSPPLDMVPLTVPAVLQVVAAAVFFVRRRWRVGTRFPAGSGLTLAANIAWTGHVLLRNDWSTLFLMW